MYANVMEVRFITEEQADAFMECVKERQPRWKCERRESVVLVSSDQPTKVRAIDLVLYSAYARGGLAPAAVLGPNPRHREKQDWEAFLAARTESDWLAYLESQSEQSISEARRE